MGQARQHVLAHQFAFVAVGIARQDEGVDAQIPVGVQLGHHLVGVTHDGRPASRPGPADAGPQVVLHVAVVVGKIPQFALAAHTG